MCIIVITQCARYTLKMLHSLPSHCKDHIYKCPFVLNAKAITAYISWAMGSNVDDDDD